MCFRKVKGKGKNPKNCFCSRDDAVSPISEISVIIVYKFMGAQACLYRAYMTKKKVLVPGKGINNAARVPKKRTWKSSMFQLR